MLRTLLGLRGTTAPTTTPPAAPAPADPPEYRHGGTSLGYVKCAHHNCSKKARPGLEERAPGHDCCGNSRHSGSSWHR
jgi:hypothetical protein